VGNATVAAAPLLLKLLLLEL
jgi:hypothetical protein